MTGATFRGRRVVVAGGLGFIGAAVARTLVADGAEVTIVDSLEPSCGGTYANIAGIENDVRVAEVDVRDGSALRPLVDGAELVMNLVGHTSHIDSMRDPLLDLELNCRSQLSLLEACRATGAWPVLVFAGTRQVYGRPRYLPVDEAHPTEPVDVNGVHKLAAEEYHLLYGRVYGLQCSILRLTNTYGPGMYIRDARQTFLGAWVAALLRGEEFEVWGDGSQLRDFTYVDDAVEALLIAAAEPRAYGRVLNLGDERSGSLRDLADLLVRVNDGGSYVVKPFPPDREVIDIGHYVGDYSAAREVLGWRPTVPLEDGLRRTLEYFRRHGASYL